MWLFDNQFNPVIIRMFLSHLQSFGKEFELQQWMTRNKLDLKMRPLELRPILFIPYTVCIYVHVFVVRTT